MRNADGRKDVFHLIDWFSQKHRRVSHSAYGAEILAATSADDRGFYHKSAINALFPGSMVKHELNFYSKGLWDTIITLHDGRKFRLRQTVQRVRNSFESKELIVVRWISGPTNFADALTKRNLHLFKELNKVCCEGYLNLNLGNRYAIDKDN